MIKAICYLRNMPHGADRFHVARALFSHIMFLYTLRQNEGMYCGEKEKAVIPNKNNCFRLVIRLGLEPKTPTLKVLCSTC